LLAQEGKKKRQDSCRASLRRHQTVGRLQQREGESGPTDRRHWAEETGCLCRNPAASPRRGKRRTERSDTSKQTERKKASRELRRVLFQGGEEETPSCTRSLIDRRGTSSSGGDELSGRGPDVQRWEKMGDFEMTTRKDREAACWKAEG